MPYQRVHSELLAQIGGHLRDTVTDISSRLSDFEVASAGAAQAYGDHPAARAAADTQEKAVQAMMDHLDELAHALSDHANTLTAAAQLFESVEESAAALATGW
jgi:uncharacterized protein YukE